MTVLLYIAGLIIGVAVFFYILSLARSGKEKIVVMTGKKPEVKQVLEPHIVNMPKTNRPPGSRTCPLCGSSLTRYEALYASYIGDASGKKILIHGCRYCYKPDEDPDRERRSAL
jgi:hypothetical protein